VEGIRPCTKNCILFLYGGTSECRNDRGSFPELRISPVCQKICSCLFRCWKREVIVLDWPENSIERAGITL
jgi:hypothetical protein